MLRTKPLFRIWCPGYSNCQKGIDIIISRRSARTRSFGTDFSTDPTVNLTENSFSWKTRHNGISASYKAHSVILDFRVCTSAKPGNWQGFMKDVLILVQVLRYSRSCPKSIRYSWSVSTSFVTMAFAKDKCPTQLELMHSYTLRYPGSSFSISSIVSNPFPHLETVYSHSTKPLLLHNPFDHCETTKYVMRMMHTLSLSILWREISRLNKKTTVRSGCSFAVNRG